MDVVVSLDGWFVWQFVGLKIEWIDKCLECFVGLLYCLIKCPYLGQEKKSVECTTLFKTAVKRFAMCMLINCSPRIVHVDKQ